MHHLRTIQAAEAQAWLSAFFNYAFLNSELELDALLEILWIGYKAAHHPTDMPNWRVAQLLLDWSLRHVDTENWRQVSLTLNSR